MEKRADPASVTLRERAVTHGLSSGVYAQTNLQLLNQLNAAGYSENDLVEVQGAYRLAVNLFSAKYRPSGKTLLAHLVGTASILASLRAPVETVIFGLLHAAYLLGDFGVRGRSAKRRLVREAVGREIESYLKRYRDLRWNESSVLDLSSGIAELDPLDRQVVLVRLANALEDHLDMALAYCRKVQARSYLDRSVAAMVELAISLGYPHLAAELEGAAEATALAQIPPSLRVDRRRTYVTAPASYRRRPTAVARDVAARALRRIKDLRGVS